MSEEKKKCFVITPIGEEGSSTRRHIDGIIKAAIRPALENKYEVKAAHEITTTGSINNQVIVEIYTSDLVVANLTELNPNVMYELAIRHAIKKPVIMIMEKGSKGLPFDVINERTIFYINDSQGVLDLKEEIVKVEDTIGNNPVSNPIFDALSIYTSDQSLIKSIEAYNKEDADVLKIILNKINRLEEKTANLKKNDIPDVKSGVAIKLNLKFAKQIQQSKRNEISKEIVTILIPKLEEMYKHIYFECFFTEEYIEIITSNLSYNVDVNMIIIVIKSILDSIKEVKGKEVTVTSIEHYEI